MSVYFDTETLVQGYEQDEVYECSIFVTVQNLIQDVP